MAKKNFINTVHLEGYVYEHKLELKETGPNSKNPGTEFISGTLNIATDDECLNVVQVHYTYVTELTAKKKPNNTYTVLKAIIDGKIGSVVEHGKENAGKVRIDTAIALNEWYDTRTEGNPLISQKRNEGGFIHQISEFNDPKTCNTFETDIVITGTKRVEADEEKGTREKVIVKGYIFNFRGDVMPVDYSVYGNKPMAWFEDLEASPKHPVFTKLRGIQVSQTVVKKVEEEGAWGDVYIRESRTSVRDFEIKWAQAEPYTWDDESTLLASELSEKLAKREIDLADMKKRQDEYMASRDNALAGSSSTKSKTTPKQDDYDF